MMKKYFLILFLAIFFINCKKEYNPPVIQAANNFLVVDGFINLNANANTIINLSRSRNLGDTVVNIAELGARVSIEESSGAAYNLFDFTNTGNYNSSNLNLSTSGKYRLKIITAGGDEYLSDFVTGKKSPPIDSLTWQQKKDVTVYVNTRDVTNSTLYYKWDFTETWEYRSRIENYWGEKNGRIFFLDSATQMHKCWTSANSNTVITGTSVALSQDVISQAPITTIIKDEERIKIRYSILVRQIPLTLEAYNYWQIIQKNSQQLGTLFDLQPSQLTGNIRSVSNPDEPVIGFISAVTTSQKRLFIANTQLTDWSTLVTGRECDLIILPTDPLDAFAYNYPDTSYAPFYFTGSGPAFLIITRKDCIDCRVKGGVTTKPVFW
jgi:hypothetical protein